MQRAGSLWTGATHLGKRRKRNEPGLIYKAATKPLGMLPSGRVNFLARSERAQTRHYKDSAAQLESWTPSSLHTVAQSTLGPTLAL